MEQTSFQKSVFANVCNGIDHLYSDGQFCDCDVIIGNVRFSCHRLVLAAVSDFFHSSLTLPFKESSTRNVNIDHEDVTGESFQLFLDILYKGKDVISMDTVKDVLKLSIFLQVKFLEEYCEQYLTDNMAPDTYLGAWQFAEKYQLMVLSDKAADMAATRFDEVAKCDELLQLPTSMLLTLLSLQKKLTMDDLIRTIFRWAEENVEERKCHLGELLPFVNVTQLTPACLDELMKYWNHPFREYVYDYIREGITFKLQGMLCTNVQIERQLKSLQGPGLSTNMPDITRCAVIVGGMQEKGKPLQDVSAVPIDAQSLSKVYRLKPLPEACGLDFATCVWRNELYVSGGSMQPKYFAVYKPGDDVWETLPSLPQGREKHTMASIDWTIYVLGGNSHEAGSSPVTDILSYKIKEKVWKNFSSLQKAVKDATSATLGHRIYVFGGEDADGHDTKIVQCIDTLTGCVYTAGRLPSLTSGALALSNGGTIFVLRSEGELLQMKENFSLADHLEKTLADKKVRMISESACAQEHNITSSLCEKDFKINETLNEEDESETRSIRFKTKGTFPSRQYFGAFLQEGSVVVYGGEPQGGEFLNDMMGVNYTDGTTIKKSRRFLRGMARFGLHVLNIPQEFLTEGNAVDQPCAIGDNVKLTRTGAKSITTFRSLGRLRKAPDSIGKITAYNDDDGQWSVDFPGYEVVNIPHSFFQLCD